MMRSGLRKLYFLKKKLYLWEKSLHSICNEDIE